MINTHLKKHPLRNNPKRATKSSKISNLYIPLKATGQRLVSIPDWHPKILALKLFPRQTSFMHRPSRKSLRQDHHWQLQLTWCMLRQGTSSLQALCKKVIGPSNSSLRTASMTTLAKLPLNSSNNQSGKNRTTWANSHPHQQPHQYSQDQHRQCSTRWGNHSAAPRSIFWSRAVQALLVSPPHMRLKSAAPHMPTCLAPSAVIKCPYPSHLQLFSGNNQKTCSFSSSWGVRIWQVRWPRVDKIVALKIKRRKRSALLARHHRRLLMRQLRWWEKRWIIADWLLAILRATVLKPIQMWTSKKQTNSAYHNLSHNTNKPQASSTLRIIAQLRQPASNL